MQAAKSDLNVLLRQDFTSFVARTFQTTGSGVYQPNWHIEAICHKLKLCERGELKRLIINVPPRSLKSCCASVALPAWILGRDPRSKVICASYSIELANELARQSRQVLNAGWYRAAFPAFKGARDTESEFLTTAGGSRYATSIGGTLTGRGADYLIIDDPLKPEDALSRVAREGVTSWFRNTLRSRLNSKKDGVIIVVMQRLHPDDLTGALLQGGGWELLSLPAIADRDYLVATGKGLPHLFKEGEVLHPAREPREVLDQLSKDMGTANFSAQYLQRPVPEGGNLVKREWLKTYERLPHPDRIIQSWDTAMKGDSRNDWSVCTTWYEARGEYFLVDVARDRVDFPSLKKWTLALSAKHGPAAILVEDKGSGTPLIQELRTVRGLSVIPMVPRNDKLTRMNVGAAMIEAGKLHIPNDADWLSTFLDELLAFPGSKHDDQVDSVSQFLEWAGERSRSRFEVDWGNDDPQGLVDVNAAFRRLARGNWS